MSSAAVPALLLAVLHSVFSLRTVDITTLRPSEYFSSRGIDSSNIHFLHNVIDVCSNPDQPEVVVVVVCSSIGNFHRRDIIRQTWADRQLPGLRVVFVLGQPPPYAKNGDVMKAAVDKESNQWGDVVQADFADTYANLTRKSVAALRWVSLHARCAGFVMKSDDDTFVNTPLLVSDLRWTAHRKFVMGNVIAAARPVREPEQKWHTPESAYRPAMYPTYASGAAYVVSGDAVDTLLEASRSTPFFWIEDVYITGMLSRASGVQLIVNGKFDGYRDLLDECSVRKHIIQHRVTDDRMKRLWALVKDEQLASKCSQVRRDDWLPL